MVNKALTIITEIKTRLEADGLRVLRYPDDIGRVGNTYPLILIKEGGKNFDRATGNRYEYDLPITLVLIGAYGTNRMSKMNDLQNQIYAALFADATLGGLAMNVNPISVDTGEIMKGSDLSAFAGHNEAASFREIQIQFRVQDARR